MAELNPQGLVWNRQPAFQFYKGDEARIYARELAADLAGSATLPEVVDYSTLPKDKLPLELWTEPPSFMEYIQAFYLWVAAGADSKAKEKLDGISTQNQQLKYLNEVINLVGELTARAREDADNAKVRQEVLTVVKNNKAIFGNTPGDFINMQLIEAGQDPLNLGGLTWTVDYAMFAFVDRYKKLLDTNVGRTLSEPAPQTAGGQAATTSTASTPQEKPLISAAYPIEMDSNGAKIHSVLRNLQAEANLRGNEVQKLMTQASSAINFQSAVNEGYKSFGDRWFQMLNQVTSST